MTMTSFYSSASGVDLGVGLRVCVMWKKHFVTPFLVVKTILSVRYENHFGLLIEVLFDHFDLFEFASDVAGKCVGCFVGQSFFFVLIRDANDIYMFACDVVYQMGVGVRSWVFLLWWFLFFVLGLCCLTSNKSTCSLFDKSSSSSTNFSPLSLGESLSLLSSSSDEIWSSTPSLL